MLEFDSNESLSLSVAAPVTSFPLTEYPLMESVCEWSAVTMTWVSIQ